MNDRSNTRNVRNARPGSDAPSVTDAPASPVSSTTPDPVIVDAPASTPPSVTPAPGAPTSLVNTTPAPSVPDGLNHVLSVPRFVAHAERWTRNAPARIVVGAETGVVTISREQTPTERGEARDKDDAPIPAPSDAKRGDVSMVAPAALVNTGRVGVTVQTGGIDAATLALFIVGVLRGAGLEAVTTEANARASESAARRTLKALRAEYDAGILSALSTIGNKACAGMVGAFWGAGANGAEPGALGFLRAAQAEALKSGITYDVAPNVRAALVKAAAIPGEHVTGVMMMLGALPAVVSAPTSSAPVTMPGTPSVTTTPAPV